MPLLGLCEEGPHLYRGKGHAVRRMAMPGGRPEQSGFAWTKKNKNATSGDATLRCTRLPHIRSTGTDGHPHADDRWSITLISSIQMSVLLANGQQIRERDISCEVMPVAELRSRSSSAALAWIDPDDPETA